MPLTSVVPIRSDSTLAARGYSTGWWCSPMSQHAFGCCAKSLSMALACAAETIPSALVKEKWESELELSRMMPKPSSRSGGTTMGKASFHRSDAAVEKIGPPGRGKSRQVGGVRAAAHRRASCRSAFPPSGHHADARSLDRY